MAGVIFLIGLGGYMLLYLNVCTFESLADSVSVPIPADMYPDDYY